MPCSGQRAGVGQSDIVWTNGCVSVSVCICAHNGCVLCNKGIASVTTPLQTVQWWKNNSKKQNNKN